MENKIEAKNLDLYYGEKHALKNVSLNIKTNHSIYRSFWMWEIDFFKNIKSYE